MKNYIVICACCGAKFVAHDIRRTYCSTRCKDVDYKRKRGQDSKLDANYRNCEICGRAFETRNYTKKTCSEQCSRELSARRSKEREKKRRRYSAGEYKMIVAANAKQRQDVKRIEKIWFTASHTVQRECEECGTIFFCLDTETRKTCSAECARKYSNIRKDKRIPKEQRIDKISLKRLFNRDSGICYLCGCKCDWDDWKVAKSGYKYPGDKYPTIEHVVPVSKGGMDSWDNVRLACAKCNRTKSDSLVVTKPLKREIAYSCKPKGNPPKKTAQYTIDGKLIRIWDSTSQIKRELGLNDKHIQSVCRKYKSNTGNAYGYHWEYVS